MYRILKVLVAVTILSGVVLSSSVVSADGDSVVDEINVSVPVSCTMSGTGMNTHSANISNGIYTAGIGTTTLHAFCNDNEGFAIYAAGYTGNEVGGTNSNKLVGTSASGNATIESGIATTAGNPDVSNWAMKLTMTQDSGDTTTDNAFTIDSAPNTSGGSDASFASYHVVPNEYTKVAHKNSGTDMTATTGGVKLTTTYAAYISKTQPADTYSGKVKYTLVHPSLAVAGKLNVTYNGNGLTFANGKATNLVSYDATTVTTTGTVTKKSYAGGYNENGEFGSSGPTYGTPVGNSVVTIDGANSIHIKVTYGAPAGYSGPPSDLSIWAGNHPDYTNVDIGTALTSCGSTNANNGAFSSSGSGGTQVTMECDITGDSVTFYDYSTNTSNSASMGYYAIVTGQGDVMAYAKTVDSGTYVAPTTRSGQDVFLGWSTNPNANADAEDPLYTNEADFIANGPYTNENVQVVLYAVWGKTFDAAYADAGKSQLSSHYKMQDASGSLCKEIYVGATGTLVDSRDGTIYVAGRLKDGKCWMLDNLALDPTDSMVAANMNASNTNATQAAITNLLNGGSSTTGWSNTAVSVATNFSNANSYIQPRINTASKNTLVTSYGPASTNSQAKVGVYYNFCAASVSTYCYNSNSGVNVSDTIIDSPQDICPANWRMPTGGSTGEYAILGSKYGVDEYGVDDPTNSSGLAYNLSVAYSGFFSSTSPQNMNDYVYLLSSTYSFSSAMYGLYASKVGSGYVNFAYVSNRNTGYPMRCLISE